MKFRNAGIFLQSETKIYHQKNGRRLMDIVRIDKCWYEIQEQKEGLLLYTNI
jgi:hypothetical protein